MELRRLRCTGSWGHRNEGGRGSDFQFTARLKVADEAVNSDAIDIAALGETAFLVSPGDIDPPDGVLWTITRTLGITYTWYPGVGNHEYP